MRMIMFALSARMSPASAYWLAGIASVMMFRLGAVGEYVQKVQLTESSKHQAAVSLRSHIFKSIC